MRSKKPTLFQQAIKEIKRLEKATRRAVKRGYTFDLPFRKTKTGTEKTRYTAKEVEYLKSLKLRDLYKYSKYGEVSGEQYYKDERKWQAREAAATRWKKERERIRERDEAEARRIQREIHKTVPSISQSMINMCMNRSDWLWSDEYYEKFAQAVYRKIQETSVDYVAQGFEEMIAAGDLLRIQKHYKPDDFLPDYATFMEYFPDLSPYINDMEENEDINRESFQSFNERNDIIVELFGE